MMSIATPANRRHKHRQRTQDRNNHIVSPIEFTYDLPIDGLLAVAYGILVAFLAIALMWWTDNRSEITYGMSGPMTTITLMNSGRSVTEEQQTDAARELRTFLSENDISMIKVSNGDGPPALVVFDPGHKIGWTNSLDAASSTVDPEPGVYTITGSYSDRTWASSGRAPLVPQGLDVLGSVEVSGLTPSNSNLQFVETPGAAPFGTGTMYLGTTDPDAVARIVELVEAQGSRLQSVKQQPPLLTSLVHDAPVAISTIFASLGLVCVMASLVLRLPEQREEIRLRALVGATGLELVRDHASRELVPALAGTMIGSGVALATTSLISVSAPGNRELVVVMLGALTGGTVMWIARQATFALVLPSYLKRVVS